MAWLRLGNRAAFTYSSIRSISLLSRVTATFVLGMVGYYIIPARAGERPRHHATDVGRRPARVFERLRLTGATWERRARAVPPAARAVRCAPSARCDR